jgi:hypothetical protein
MVVPDSSIAMGIGTIVVSDAVIAMAVNSIYNLAPAHTCDCK